MKLKEEFLDEFSITDEEEAEEIAKKLIHLDYNLLHEIVIWEMCNYFGVANANNVEDSEWNEHYFDGYQGVAEKFDLYHSIIKKLYWDTDWDIWEDDTGADEEDAVLLWAAVVKRNNTALNIVPKSLREQVKEAARPDISKEDLSLGFIRTVQRQKLFFQMKRMNLNRLTNILKQLLKNWNF